VGSSADLFFLQLGTAIDVIILVIPRIGLNIAYIFFIPRTLYPYYSYKVWTTCLDDLQFGAKCTLVGSPVVSVGYNLVFATIGLGFS